MLWLSFVFLRLDIQIIGESDEEGKGGQVRATLLSNRATTLLKVFQLAVNMTSCLIFRQLKRYEEALADTDASLALFSTSFKALRTRARINLHLEKFDTAIADFKSATQQAGVEGNDADVRALKSELKKAEAALKRSKTKDYYKILGVSRDCNELDIKKAYRRESLKHHPDKVSNPLYLYSQNPRVARSNLKPQRVGTKKNSNSWWRLMLSYPTHNGASGTIWVTTRMG